jgi:hypothetical protein
VLDAVEDEMAEPDAEDAATEQPLWQPFEAKQ